MVQAGFMDEYDKLHYRTFINSCIGGFF